MLRLLLLDYDLQHPEFDRLPTKPENAGAFRLLGMPTAVPPLHWFPGHGILTDGAADPPYLLLTYVRRALIRDTRCRRN